MPTVDEAVACAAIMDERTAEYQRARHEYQQAAAAFQEHLVILKQMILDVADSLSRDGMDAALGAVVAIQKGEADRAYDYARMAARMARMVESAHETLFGPITQHDERSELPRTADAVDPSASDPGTPSTREM